uniref:hypothetical protein n=1 Tax=Candidatus Scatocola faecipullorum TaxID=2840917 RepID=UPI00402997B0
MNKNIINIDKSNIETSSVTNDDISKNKQLSLFNESNITLSDTSVSSSIIANNSVFHINLPESTPTINDFVSLIEKIANLVIDNEDMRLDEPILSIVATFFKDDSFSGERIYAFHEPLNSSI